MAVIEGVETNVLAAARSIGARLARDAFWDGERCNWLGDSMEHVDGDWRVVRRSFGPELYGGTAGVALFLASLYDALGEGPFRTAAEGAIAQALSRLDDVADAFRCGFYSGRTGIAHVLLRCGELLGRVDLRERGLAQMAEVAAIDPATQEVDVISGSAGAVAPLLDAAARHDRADFRTAAIRHGERLLAEARIGERGWSWDTMHAGPGQPDLNGYAHGVAGIACALAELYAVTGDDRFAAAAREGFRYERSWFNPAFGNWPDLREHARVGESGGEPSYTVAWCHGAPGIGLSRLRAWRILKDAALRSEAETAIGTTVAALDAALYSRIQDCSLCHGFLGNTELLLEAHAVLDADEYREKADAYAAAATARLGRDGFPWPCGVPGGRETPTLMLGLAGIGYFFLRMHDARRYPSVLLVTPTAV